MLDANGKWLYSSLPQTPLHNNSDRRYFTYHRETPGSALRINEPLQSRLTGRSTIILSKRIDRQDGSFGGVLTAAIDSDYFNEFYRTFQLGPDGSISLLRDDGIVLIRWPVSEKSTDLSSTELFSKHLKQSSVGYYKIISPFDGIEKYIGYEKTPHFHDGRHRGDFGRVAAVRLAEDVAHRRDRCRPFCLCMILLLAAVLFSQFRFRMRTERALREREAHYRLLANNIADIIILIDARSLLRYVSQSVEPVLGMRPEDLLGKSCFDMIHPEDQGKRQVGNGAAERDRYRQHGGVSNLARRRDAGLGRKQVQAGGAAGRPGADGIPLRHPRRHRTQADGG